MNLDPSDYIDEEEVLPPLNFAMVEKGVYRSSFPMRKNFTFLEKLGLRTILTLVLEEYPTANCDFNKWNQVTLLQFGMEGNKEPFRVMPVDKVYQALAAIMDPRNHPVLIHCNEGKHRTGCLVGCLRRVRGWALSAIFDEYLLYGGRKSRMVDQRFIEMIFDPQAAIAYQQHSAHVSPQPAAAAAAAAAPAAAERGGGDPGPQSERRLSDGGWQIAEGGRHHHTPVVHGRKGIASGDGGGDSGGGGGGGGGGSSSGSENAQARGFGWRARERAKRKAEQERDGEGKGGEGRAPVPLGNVT